MGYEWIHRIRAVPLNGSARTYQLNQIFSDASGPTKTDVRYDVVKDSRYNVDRWADPLIHGWRVRVILTLEIVTMEEEHWLAEILNRLSDREEWTIYLSLNGGTTEREIVLRDFKGPTPLGGKTHAGAQFVLDVECVELITEKPDLMDGNW